MPCITKFIVKNVILAELCFKTENSIGTWFVELDMYMYNSLYLKYYIQSSSS